MAQNPAIVVIDENWDAITTLGGVDIISDWERLSVEEATSRAHEGALLLLAGLRQFDQAMERVGDSETIEIASAEGADDEVLLEHFTSELLAMLSKRRSIVHASEQLVDDVSTIRLPPVAALAPEIVHADEQLIESIQTPEDYSG